MGNDHFGGLASGNPNGRLHDRRRHLRWAGPVPARIDEHPEPQPEAHGRRPEEPGFAHLRRAQHNTCNSNVIRSGTVSSGIVIAGRYRVEARIGGGGMGTVHRAVDLRHQGEGSDTVAIKFLTGQVAPADNDRFIREIELLAQVKHPGVVGYLDHGMTPNQQDGTMTRFLVMEWIAGDTLRQRLHHRGFTVAETALLGQRIAEVLAAVHERGIVHRDVKPTNILLPTGGRAGELAVKLIDFGIARRAHDEGGPTRTGMMIGTPGYMAPEQARGVRAIDGRADLFALGCILYECLTGRAAFAGTTSWPSRPRSCSPSPPRCAGCAPRFPRSWNGSS